MRTTALLLAALVVHLLVISLLALQLPAPAHASVAPAATDTHHAHEPIRGSNSGPGIPYFDLTPPEVRSLGGSTLVEVLEAPPSIELPHVLQLALPIDTWASTAVLPAPLVDVPLGRAPPVR